MHRSEPRPEPASGPLSGPVSEPASGPVSGPVSGPTCGRGGLLRFTRAERWTHRATGLLMGVCIVTAAVLYIGPLSVLVGRRDLIVGTHVAAGILLPVPMLLAWLSPAFRADVRELNRFGAADWQWLAAARPRWPAVGRQPGALRRRPAGALGRPPDLPVGKFNAGQKIYGAFTAGAILVMFGTGLIMRYAQGWPVSLRTGATFVHDWLAFALLAALAGHLWKAFQDPTARLGMRSGFVPPNWAVAEHPGWARPRQPASGRPADPVGGSSHELAQGLVHRRGEH
jgi:formate dehydrogenase subunit gamma